MTVPLPGTTTSTSNLYYEFHIPLGVYNAIRRLLQQQVADPNLPNPIVDASKGREWFSQPRPATQGDLPKPTLFHATGTAYLLDVFGQPVGQIGGGETVITEGLDGQTFVWDGAIANDPFWKMVDKDLWIQRSIKWADALFPGLQSISEGVAAVAKAINSTPGAFALAGYSQGAAVMSIIYRELQNGYLKHRKKDLIAAVMFGNPCRQTGRLFPGANPVGSWDAPNNYATHGTFAQDMRLSTTEDLWWEFANENEPVSTVGDTDIGIDWVTLVSLVVGNMGSRDLGAFIDTHMLDLPWDTVGDVIGAISSILNMGDIGHGKYWTDPPPGDPRNGMTSYQIALQYLRDVGEQYRRTRTYTNQTEVIQVNFKLPMPINDVSFEAVKVPSQIDLWYRDRQDNWRSMLDENRNPISVTLPSAASESWLSHHVYTSPTVAKAVQFRLSRIPDPAMGSRPYCVGLRNVLMRRNIYTRPSAVRATTITEDSLGNVVETIIKDWDAPRAIDNNPTTFWKSEPQPDPNAVVYLILDVRTADGSPQLIDTLYIDPVYTGAALNVYYGNGEDSTATQEPSPIFISPQVEAHTRWQAGKGLWDVATGAEVSEFVAPFRIGPLVRQNCWIGVEWTPDFVATSPPGSNPVLFEIIPDNPEPGQFWPRLSYDVGNLGYGSIVLEFDNGTTIKTFSAPLSPPLVQDEPIQIVAGWAYDAPGSAVYISVMSKGTEIASYYVPTTLNLPPLITMDGAVSVSRFRGRFTAHIVKRGSWLNEAERFLANPRAYTDPDPIIPDAGGTVASSSLDNAVLSCDWTSQRYPVGGMTTSAHSDRQWTPIWRDYTVQRGKIFFPRQISARYLKLEMTKLTPEPYPIYDTGIQVTYETFPISVYADMTTKTTTTTMVPTTQTVTQQTTSTVHTPGLFEQIGNAIGDTVEAIGGAVNGLLGGIGNFIGGIAAVNWLDPASVTAALDASQASTTQPIVAMAGTATETGSIPNTLATALGQSTGANAVPGTDVALRTEATSSLVNRRTTADANVLAGQAVNKIVSELPNQVMASPVSGVIEDVIAQDFSPALSSPTAAAVAPMQGTDFWLFPGGLLKMKTAVMEGLFGSTTTVTGTLTSKISVPTPNTTTTSTTQRMRFDTTETHIYRRLVVMRDAAVGYFAGIREIAAYATTYIDYEDPQQFSFTSYNPNQWAFTNIRQLTSGAVTTAGTPYEADVDFVNLDSWNMVGDWSWDGTQDSYSGNRIGAATIVAVGEEASLTSRLFAVDPDDDVIVRGSVKFTGATSDTGGRVVMEVISYLDGEVVDEVSLTPIPSTDVGVDASVVEITEPTGKTDGVTFQHLMGTYTVPSDGVDALAVRFRITEEVTGGQFWIAECGVDPNDERVRGFLFDRFITFSTFSKVVCDFRDSGLRKSDAMWARTDPLNTNIDRTQLAWYTTPSTMPAGMWGDQFADWADENVRWGNARATVAIWIDPERMYKGNRALHFRRAAGAGSAGVRVIQQTNMVPGGMARIGCIFYKPTANTNTITLRLRRVSDGVYIHEEEIPDVPVGLWYTHHTTFFELPDSLDQIYMVELHLSGTFEDDLYVSDLYTEVAHIRYFMRLGGVSNPNAVNIDVTELAHTDNNAIVTCTEPTNEVSLEAVILTPRAVAYGVTMTPVYLQ